MAKVLVSFKAKEKDLFELVESQGDKSNFVKDALKFYIEYKDKKVKTPARAEVNAPEILDILESI